MDIRQLKYLIALDRACHFGQAAATCHITQPTLSMRIRNSGEELNLTFIQRGQRFEGFAPEGERILTWARVVLAAHDDLVTEAAVCRGQTVGQLWIDIVLLASLNPMQPIKPLTEEYPALQLGLLSMTSEQIIDGVSHNQLDLGIYYLQHLGQRLFKIAWLLQIRMGSLHGKRHFDFGGETPRWKAPVTLSPGLLIKGMCYQESAEISFKAKGLTPKYVFESDSVFQIIQAVQAGICCAIMPLNNGFEVLSGNLEILPIAETQVDSQLTLITRQQEPVSTPAERCFAEVQGIFG